MTEEHTNPGQSNSYSTNPHNWVIKETKIGSTEEKIRKGQPVPTQGPINYNPTLSKNHVPTKED